MKRQTPWLVFLCIAFAWLAGAPGCGIEASDEGEIQHTVFRELRTDLVRPDVIPDPIDESTWSWPSGPRDHALIEVAGHGQIRIELYPELAPQTVKNFRTLANLGFYDGTTFHRAVDGFMIQGGDPNSRDDDPTNDGQGGPDHTIADELSDAPHLRGVLSMANFGDPDTGGSQFFILHGDARHLDHRHALFGRVIEGMDVVDSIAAVETDKYGRWGPKDRPLENVVVRQVVIERLQDRGAGAGATDLAVAAPAAPAP